LLVTVFVLALVVYAAVGIYFWRKSQTTEGYYVADRKGSLLLMTGTITASWASVVGFVGFTGNAWNIGFSPVTLIWSFWGYALIFTFVLGIPLRRFGGYTVPDFFGDRFNSNALRAVAAVIIIISVGAYAIVQIVGMGVVLNALGISYLTGTIIASAIVLLYVLTGGMWAVIVTETIQFFIFLAAGVVLLPAVLLFIGGGSFVEGFKVLVVDLPSKHPHLLTAFGGAGFGWVLANNLAWNLGIPPMPHLISRAYIAENERTLAKAILLTVTIGIPWCWLIYPSGTAMRAVWTNINQIGGSVDNVMPNIVKTVLPEWLGALVLAGVMAVALSTVASQIPQIAFGVARDIYHKIINPNASDKKILNLTRGVIIVIAPIFVFLAAIKPVTIMVMGVWAAAVSAGAFLPAFIAGIYWRRATKSAVLSGMVVSTLLAMLFTIKVLPLPFNLHMIYWVVLASMLVIIVGSYLTKPTPNELSIFDTLSQKMSQRTDLPEAGRKDYMVPFISIAVSLLFLLVYGATFLAFPGSKAGWDLFGAIAYTEAIPVVTALIIIYKFKNKTL